MTFASSLKALVEQDESERNDEDDVKPLVKNNRTGAIRKQREVEKARKDQRKRKLAKLNRSLDTGAEEDFVREKELKALATKGVATLLTAIRKSQKAQKPKPVAIEEDENEESEEEIDEEVVGKEDFLSKIKSTA